MALPLYTCVGVEELSRASVWRLFLCIDTSHSTSHSLLTSFKSHWGLGLQYMDFLGYIPSGRENLLVKNSGVVM